MALAEHTRTDAEDELRQAMMSGRLVDWRTRDATADDPAHGDRWGAQRTVAAALLADLLRTSTAGSRRPRALQLAGARIVGRLDLEAAELGCPLLLWGCWFAEPVILDEAQAPAVRLPGCRLPRLSAPQLTTRGDLSLKGFTATREVELLGAHIGGQLDLRGATLTNPDGHALTADGLTVDQGMFCSEGFTARGEVRLLGAKIGSQLDLRGATLTNFADPALNADQLAVDQDMVCSEGFTARGEVRLVGAKIGGQLNLTGATLTNLDGPALTVVGARIGGSLDLSGATLGNADGPALIADLLTVDQGMVCSEGFTVRGEVRLVGAKIGGQLNFRGATLTNPNGRALDLSDLRAGSLFMQDLTEPPGQVDLVHAQVGALLDEPASWPRQAVLDGFVYDALYDRDRVRARRRPDWLARSPRADRTQPDEFRPVRARQRLDWLARDPRGYRPQPYEQLAAVYRRGGRTHDAHTVAIAKHWRQRRTLNPLGKLWNLLLYATVGYGYRMWLAIGWLLVLVGLGWCAFDRVHPADLAAAKPPGQRPWFHAAVYAFDLLLPFADLGYQGTWIATGSARWLFLGWNLAGWILTTAVVAAVTGLLKRD
jgi:hypothetical protein